MEETDKRKLRMATTDSVSRRNHWNACGRSLSFVLGASAIGCLLADFYRLCPMRIFTPFIFLPAFLALLGLGALDLTLIEF
jgi:hypothetical protein